MSTKKNNRTIYPSDDILKMVAKYCKKEDRSFNKMIRILVTEAIEYRQLDMEEEKNANA